MDTRWSRSQALEARMPWQTLAVVEALRLQGASSARLRSLDDSGWQEVLGGCDRMQLTLPLALRPVEGFPAWVGERLARNLADTALRYERVQQTHREASQALSNSAVPHLVLKGFALSPSFVKFPNFRMQGDIDFYTPKHHIDAAVQALEAIGYGPAGPAAKYREADHVPTLIRMGGWKRSSNPYDPEVPLALELHFCFWNERVSLIRLPETEDFWDRRVLRNLGGLSFWSLDSVDLLSYFALHLLRDVFPGPRLVHHALELATFLHESADDSAFWAEWGGRCSPRLKQMQGIGFALASVLFFSRLSDAAREQIDQLPAPLRLWIEKWGAEMLAERFSRTRNGRLLQFMLADSFAGRVKILGRALSPGSIASPREVAGRQEHLQSPVVPRQRRLLQYPAYLVSRAGLCAAAVLRFFANGLTLLLSEAVRRPGMAQLVDRQNLKGRAAKLRF